MDQELPHRCPHCHALVVDRRWPNCTTCQQALPAEWIMTRNEAAKLAAVDKQSKGQHVQSMRTLDPMTDPNVPGIVKVLDSNASWFSI
jgi:hypothetical protein